MFVDASAIVAILTREPEADLFVDLLDANRGGVTSAIAVFEATLGLSRKHAMPPDEALTIVKEFLDLANIRIVEIKAADGDLAIAAFARFGKGRGSPAQLNLGDCFSYACAQSNGLPLLFKGDDFSKTDVDRVIG